jgi:hypothetical protein
MATHSDPLHFFGMLAELHLPVVVVYFRWRQNNTVQARTPAPDARHLTPDERHLTEFRVQDCWLRGKGLEMRVYAVVCATWASR